MKEYGERLDQNTINTLRDKLSPSAKLLIAQEKVLQDMEDPEVRKDMIKAQRTLFGGMSLLDQSNLESYKDHMTLQGKLKGGEK